MSQQDLPARLEATLQQAGAALWGFADVAGLPEGELARYPCAVSFALAMDPGVMASIAQGPNEAYSQLYDQVNQRLNQISRQLAAMIQEAGHQAWPVPASLRSDPARIRGDFPHKTAATRAGLGWIGKNAQLITFSLGPWLRLGTVLTDTPLPVGRPVSRSFCGQCDACVKACPAGVLRGALWEPGLDREEIFSPAGCDGWKKEHYFHLHQGHNCGICTSACIYGRKLLRRED